MEKTREVAESWLEGYKNAENHILNMSFFKRLIFVLFGKYILRK